MTTGISPEINLQISPEMNSDTNQEFESASEIPARIKNGIRRQRISERFQELREKGEAGLICYIMAGDPSAEVTKENVKALVKGGADIIELGFPFSDPVADGPTIQAAGQRALAAEMDIQNYFKLVRTLEVQIPLVCMTYYNPVFKFGKENFVTQASEVGIGGLIIPDIPVEETADLKKDCEKAGIDLIFLIAPTTTEERIQKILEKGSGFLYLVSRLGVTGARADISASSEELLSRVKTDLPKAVGFGISTGKQAEEIREAGADAVIVGSAFVKIIEEGQNSSRRLEALAKELKSGLLKAA